MVHVNIRTSTLLCWLLLWTFSWSTIPITIDAWITSWVPLCTRTAPLTTCFSPKYEWPYISHPIQPRKKMNHCRFVNVHVHVNVNRYVKDPHCTKIPTRLFRSSPASSHEEDLEWTRQVIHNHYQQQEQHQQHQQEQQVSHPTDSKLDHVLSQLTYAFPIFVLSSALLGSFYPHTLLWVNHGNRISILLASVMIAMGMTLDSKDFSPIWELFSKNRSTTSITTSTTTTTSQWKRSVPVGIACQYGIMPLAAWFIGNLFFLQQIPMMSATHSTLSTTFDWSSSSSSSLSLSNNRIALYLGLILVGSAPGGTASNLVSLIAGADVALSITLTAISTLLAAIATPFFVQFLVGKTIQIQGQALCIATAQVVFAPILLGMILKAKLPTLAHFVSRFAPFASVLIVSLICGGVVSNNSSLLVQFTSFSTTGFLLPKMIASVLLLHILGFTMGYIVPRFLFRMDRKTSRTISIETGMQNSALAVVLAKSIGASPMAGLPGAFSATVHSCLGSFLAVYWKWLDSRMIEKEKKEKTSLSEGT